MAILGRKWLLGYQGNKGTAHKCQQILQLVLLHPILLQIVDFRSSSCDSVFSLLCNRCINGHFKQKWQPGYHGNKVTTPECLHIMLLISFVHVLNVKIFRYKT